MADDRFDELTRKLAGPQSRGTMMKTLLGIVLGGALLPASALAEREDRKICIAKGGRCFKKKGGGSACCHGLRCRARVCKQGGPCLRYCT